jgi:hypothetical protein
MIRGGLSNSLASHHALEQFYMVSGICIPLAIGLEIRKRYNKSSNVPETVKKTLHSGDRDSVKFLKPELTEEQKKIVSLIQKATPVERLKADFPHK